jgi:hypothetical protein
MDENTQLNRCINSLVTPADSTILKTQLAPDGCGWAIEGYVYKKAADLVNTFLEEGFIVSLDFSLNSSVKTDITQTLCKVYMAKLTLTIPLLLKPFLETDEESKSSVIPHCPAEFYVNKGQHIIGHVIKNVTNPFDTKAIHEFLGRMALSPTHMNIDGWQYYCNKPSGTLLRLNIQPQGIVEPFRFLQVKSECVYAHIEEIFVNPFGFEVNFYVHSKIHKPLYNYTASRIKRMIFKPRSQA